MDLILYKKSTVQIKKKSILEYFMFIIFLLEKHTWIVLEAKYIRCSSKNDQVPYNPKKFHEVLLFEIQEKTIGVLLSFMEQTKLKDIFFVEQIDTIGLCFCCNHHQSSTYIPKNHDNKILLFYQNESHLNLLNQIYKTVVIQYHFIFV